VPVGCILIRKVDRAIIKKILNFVFAFFAIYAKVYLFRLWWSSIHASKPEVVCVTGLPARTAIPFVPFFFLRANPPSREPYLRPSALASVSLLSLRGSQRANANCQNQNCLSEGSTPLAVKPFASQAAWPTQA
jgi:hypothetical protein